MNDEAEAGASKQMPMQFLLSVTGQIETVEIPSATNLYCKYCFVFGADWRQVGGMEKGMSQIGHSQEGGNRITLNTPLEATFCSRNPFKWPQIVVSFYGQDLLGNDVPRGYSATHMPTVPSSTKRKCPIFLPQATTTMQRILGMFTGRCAEFVDPRIVSVAEGRDVTRVSTNGFVEITLNSMFKDTKKMGYDLNTQKVTNFAELPMNFLTVTNKDMMPIAAKVSEGEKGAIEPLKEEE